MSLGNILRNAREEKGLSPNDVAEQTNMMVQIVEELENEDFHRIAAPIYGRGFLKLYAELLGIDVKPLIEEFMDIYTGKVAPELRKRDLGTPSVQDNPVPVNQAEGVLHEPAEKIPQRVEIVPAQAVTTLNAAPKPLLKTESELPLESAEESIPQQPDKEPVVEDEPLPMVESMENEPSEVPSVEDVDEQALPEVGKGLFDSDEPNLFNTTPLQQRIAEARRLMDEKDGGEKEKKSTLHMGSNPKLPIFQIGGRMDQTYDTELRGVKSKPRIKIPGGALLTGFNRLIDQLCDRVPFDLSKKSFYVFGLLGLIVIVLMTAGISALFKLTASNKNSDGEEVAVVEQILAEPLQTKAPESDDKVPSPPDMYFD